MSLADECTLLVPSCDAYSDLWAPFFEVFWRFWPDCPFPVCLGSNELRPRIPRVQVIPAGGGMIWANRVQQQVAAIPTPYVLLMLEDFFLRRPVPTAELLACADDWRAIEGHCLRLVRRPGPNTKIPGQHRIGRLNHDAPYRVSTQAAIWKKETLLALMRPGESIWQFELEGTPRSRFYPDGFYGVWVDQLPYGHHVVQRGKWFRHSLRWCRSMNVECDTDRRPVMSWPETAVWRWQKARSVMAECLPYPSRRRLRAWLGKVPV